MKLKCGLEVYGVIYKITNKANNKVYIGQTIRGFDNRYHMKGKDIERVYNYHKSKKEYKENYNDHLFRSINKYGFENFYVNKVFDIAFSKEELDIKEKLWIKYYNATDKNYGYNLDGGGSRGTRSCDTKQKLREANLGKISKKRKKIICITTGKIFDYREDAGVFYNIKGTQNITNCCNNKSDSCGRFNGEKLRWMYYDDYLKVEDKNSILNKFIEKDSKFNKKLLNTICNLWDNNNSIIEISKLTGFCKTTVSKYIKYGLENSLCSKTKDEANKESRIICLNNLTIYKNVNDCINKIYEIMNIKLSKTRVYSSYKHNEDTKGLRFMKYCIYEKLTDYEKEALKEKYYNKINKKEKKQLIIKSGKLGEKITEPVKIYKDNIFIKELPIDDIIVFIKNEYNIELKRRYILRVCRREREYYKGFHFEYSYIENN